MPDVSLGGAVTSALGILIVGSPMGIELPPIISTDITPLTGSCLTVPVCGAGMYEEVATVAPGGTVPGSIVGTSYAAAVPSGAVVAIAIGTTEVGLGTP
jgi:hypothetical protein